MTKNLLGAVSATEGDAVPCSVPTLEQVALLEAEIAALKGEVDRLRRQEQWTFDVATGKRTILGGIPEPPCQKCGGPHRFDTSVPSMAWNAVIRRAKLPDLLCAACILSAFARAEVSFTARLFGDGFDGLPIYVRINNRNALIVAALQDELAQLKQAEGRTP